MLPKKNTCHVFLVWNCRYDSANLHSKRFIKNNVSYQYHIYRHNAHLMAGVCWRSINPNPICRSLRHSGIRKIGIQTTARRRQSFASSSRQPCNFLSQRKQFYEAGTAPPYLILTQISTAAKCPPKLTVVHSHREACTAAT